MSVGAAIVEVLSSGRLFEYLARRPGNRATTVRCPRGRAGTTQCKRWAPGCGVSGMAPTMNQELSATDIALRKRLTELSVHVPCGGLRGPLRNGWQSCPDEDSPEIWPGCDVSRERDLCIVCFRATAGGTSRWAWLACDNCRAVNATLSSRFEIPSLALGRHSLMNGIGVAGGSTAEVKKQETRLAGFATRRYLLRGWRSREYARLASVFDPLADVPLCVWQSEWPPDRKASEDAFDRLLGESRP